MCANPNKVQSSCILSQLPPRKRKNKFMVIERNTKNFNNRKDYLWMNPKGLLQSQYLLII